MIGSFRSFVVALVPEKKLLEDLPLNFMMRDELGVYFKSYWNVFRNGVSHAHFKMDGGAIIVVNFLLNHAN